MFTQTSFFMVVDSLAAAQAWFMRRISDESSSFDFARLVIFEQVSSNDAEFNMSSNFDWAVSIESRFSSVQSYARTADRHLAPSLIIAF